LLQGVKFNQKNDKGVYMKRLLFVLILASVGICQVTPANAYEPHALTRIEFAELQLNSKSRDIPFAEVTIIQPEYYCTGGTVNVFADSKDLGDKAPGWFERRPDIIKRTIYTEAFKHIAQLVEIEATSFEIYMIFSYYGTPIAISKNGKIVLKGEPGF